MTVQIIRGSCRHALGRMVQTVVSFSCVKIVSLLFKLQLLKAKEILYTEQVEQTQQFTCCLADTQQTGSSLLPADLAFLRGDLKACVLVRCSLKALSPFLRCRQIPHCSSHASPYIFTSFYTLLFLPCVSSTAASSFSWVFLSILLADVIKSYFPCYLQVPVFGRIHVPNMIVSFFL